MLPKQVFKGFFFCEILILKKVTAGPSLSRVTETPHIWDLAHFLVIQGLNTVKFMKSLSKQGKESIPQVLSDIFEIYRKN